MLARLSVDAEVFSQQASAPVRPELPQGGSQCVCVALLLRDGCGAAGWKDHRLILEHTWHVLEVHVIDQFKNLSLVQLIGNFLAGNSESYLIY